MGWSMSEQPNPAKPILISLAREMESARMEIRSCFDMVRDPFDQAWRGDTPERQEFAGRLEMYARSVEGRYEEAVMSMNEAVRVEPDELRVEEWVDDPRPRGDMW